MVAHSCSMCGDALDAHERHVRMRVPDDVLALDSPTFPEGTWMSGEDVVGSVMLQVPGCGDYLRALLPVHLTTGGSVVYGVWVEVSQEDLRGAFSVWWEPEYERLRLRGALATSIEPWGLLHAPVELAVLDPDQTPWCVASDDAALADVLTRPQPPEGVLGLEA